MAGKGERGATYFQCMRKELYDTNRRREGCSYPSGSLSLEIVGVPCVSTTGARSWKTSFYMINNHKHVCSNNNDNNASVDGCLSVDFS